MISQYSKLRPLYIDKFECSRFRNHSLIFIKQKIIGLLEALSKLLNCKPINLHDQLNHAANVDKVNVFLKGKKLRTTYLDRNGEKKDLKDTALGLKNTNQQHAYEG